MRKYQRRRAGNNASVESWRNTVNARQIEDTKMNEIENWVLAAMRSFLYGHNINAVGGIENVLLLFT